MRRLASAALLTILCVTRLAAGEEIPGAAQTRPVAIVNAIVHTITNGTITKATVVFDKGRVVAVGTDAAPPQGADVIDAKGGHVYPGFIAPTSTLGLTEIDAVRSTRDMAETGAWNPNVTAATAYNPDSEIIPTVRSNGVLLAHVTPVGGIVSGRSSVMRLDGWTREDIAVLSPSGLVVSWPWMDVSTAWWVRESPDEQRKKARERVQELYRFFDEARAYASRKKNGVDSNVKDVRFEAMVDVVEGRVPVFIQAASRTQIDAVLEFRRTYDLRIVLVDAAEARLVADVLAKEKIPVILPRTHSLPFRDEDAFDAPFTLAADLVKAGVMVAFSEDGAWQQRNLPLHAGSAMAYGLSRDDAERALTLWPAMILGISKDYGSIEVGKSATLFISKGDALDALSNSVTYAVIDGRTVDLSNRHVRLSKKYRERYAR